VFGIVLELGDDVSAGGGAGFGPLGEYDCCFEQADPSASAPRHNASMLRFIDHLIFFRSNRL
jgi:hypothetical protein